MKSLNLALNMPSATEGVIALINLESSRVRSWHMLNSFPDRSETKERVLQEEQQRIMYLSDATALDRLQVFAETLCHDTPCSVGTQIFAAKVASMRHCFASAALHLAEAEALSPRNEDLDWLRLSMKQATGENLYSVLEQRLARADAYPSLENIVPLGALLADLGHYEAAEQAYSRAIANYRDVSPFPVAWVCFQMGLLWGEIHPERNPSLAAMWYRKALSYLPAYVHARVHLAELCLEGGDFLNAETLLKPLVECGDPEVSWRYSQVLSAQRRDAEAEKFRDAASLEFCFLLKHHELAFADHAAAFFLCIGNDPVRACHLALLNLANRPTLRAFELAYSAAIASGDAPLASELADQAHSQWKHIESFAFSPLKKVSE